MTSPAPTPERRASREDLVFDDLVAELLKGRYPVGSRLAPERDLALRYGTSRSTVREALRRIETLGLVRARQGSGLEVRDLFRDGRIGLLPVWLRAGAPGAAPAVVLKELLRLRRILVAEILRMCAAYSNGSSIGEARARLAAAWQVRADRSAFLRADFELMHSLTSASGFAPAAWMLNAVEGVYVELAGQLAPLLPTPRDYHRVHAQALDALEARDPGRAVELVDGYFERHDKRLLEALRLT
ncbi:MAG: FadR family transcriptional regulator [Deltaproteobacteria bacterium]|nr:FadR family transcriptional regulator [Deltaproteobacteria bacterium]